VDLGADGLVETETDVVLEVEHERRARLVRAERLDLLLDAEATQEWNDRRHQGFADDDRRALGLVEQHHAHAGTREIRAEASPRRSTSENRNAARRAFRHPRDLIPADTRRNVAKDRK